MAEMIPRVLDIENPSDGEVHLFERLKKDPDTSSWVILHSLNISHHKTQILGEIDFLVFIPETCIFAIEVKAHRYAKYENGLWYLGKSSKGSVKGPFNQVKDSVFSLLEYLKSKNTNLKNIPIFPFVIFTHTELESPSIEWHSREFCGVKEYRKIPISKLLISRAISHRRKLFDTPTAKWFHLGNKRPSRKDIEAILKITRPSIEMATNYGFFRPSANSELKSLTQEQFTALDAMEDNQRVVFNGAAGVGKTILALEAAIRASQRKGKVLFLCKNKFLSIDIKRAYSGSDLDIFTITDILEKYAGFDFVNHNNKSIDDYWDTKLPEKAFEELLKKDYCPYSYLIIDEAQDILSVQNWLDCIELLFEGGFSNGRWSFFGDFELQNIYSVFRKTNFFDELRVRCNNFSIYRLTINCRNIKAVSELSFSLADIKIPYSKFLRTENPIFDSKYYFYSSEKELVEKIKTVVDELTKNGFKLSEIVILSKVAEEKSTCKKYEKELNIFPFHFRDKDIQYTSIHKYKGLESPVVILTDFDEIESEASKKMLYVGASRATEIVIYLFKDSVRAYLIEGFKGKK